MSSSTKSPAAEVMSDPFHHLYIIRVVEDDQHAALPASQPASCTFLCFGNNGHVNHHLPAHFDDTIGYSITSWQHDWVTIRLYH